MYYSCCTAWNKLYPSVIRRKPGIRIQTSTLCNALGQPVSSMIITSAELEIQPLSYQAGTASLTVDIAHASLSIYGCQGTSITSTVVRFDPGIRYPESDPDTSFPVSGFLTRVTLASIRR